MAEFRMPSLGADMEYGRVTQWLVKPGDHVGRGQIVAVVETEKADIDVEIFEDGVIQQIVAAEGDRVPVGAVLALIGADEAGAPAAVEIVTPEPEAVATPGPERIEIGAPSQQPAGGRPGGAMSPVVRKLAPKLGVDLTRVRGTGPGGAITRTDVVAASERETARHPVAAVRPSAPPAGSTTRGPRSSPYARRRAAELGIALDAVAAAGPPGVISAADVERAVVERAPTPGDGKARRVVAGQKLAAMRHATGVLMSRSKREIPHYYLSHHVDMTRAIAWVEAANVDRPVAERILPAALVLRATALACREVPEMNGFCVDEEFRPSEAVHLGVAISLRGGGLIAPAIRDADSLSVDDLMRALRDLVGRARVMKLRGSEMTDATITVTNLGEQGVEAVYGVIYPPQVALLGFGRTREQPWAENGMVASRPIALATLSADHRVSDGHRGGLFLLAIERLLQEPEGL